MHRCSIAARSFVPNESEIFQSLGDKGSIKKSKELDAFGLVLAILKGDGDYPVAENLRTRIARAIIEDWCKDFPEHKKISYALGTFPPVPLPPPVVKSKGTVK